jgi:hypothetical protein
MDLAENTRRIALEPWQTEIVRAHPVDVLRGLVDSDGCRHRRVVRGRNDPAYGFTNRSDILRLFMWVCSLVGIRSRRASRRTISIARRADRVRLDQYLGLASDDAAGPTPHTPTSSRPR